jgi:hypothetical protein
MTLVPEHLREAPYAGALFIPLGVAAFAAAILLSATDHELVWLSAGAISLGEPARRGGRGVRDAGARLPDRTVGHLPACGTSAVPRR